MKSNLKDNSKNKKNHDLGKIFDKHVKHEFEDKDVKATMTTMVDEPYVHNVPTLTGGIGYAGVYNFYTNHFVGKMPQDTEIIPISRTVGKDQVVDELILKFTHDVQIDYMLPGILPTGKHVEIAHVVIMKFKGNKIVHEHIYWDQGSLLAQIGMLDPKLFPVIGLKQARKLLELSKK